MFPLRRLLTPHPLTHPQWRYDEHTVYEEAIEQYVDSSEGGYRLAESWVEPEHGMGVINLVVRTPLLVFMELVFTEQSVHRVPPS